MRVRPMLITESGARMASFTGLPLSCDAVGRAEVVHLGASAVPEDLDVLAGDARVVDGDVGVAAPADHGATWVIGYRLPPMSSTGVHATCP